MKSINIFTPPLDCVAVGPVVIAGPTPPPAAAAAAAATCLMLRQLQRGFVTPNVHKALDHIVSPLLATLKDFRFPELQLDELKSF